MNETISKIATYIKNQLHPERKKEKKVSFFDALATSFEEKIKTAKAAPVKKK